MKIKYLTPELRKEDLYTNDVMAASSDSSSSSETGPVENANRDFSWLLN